VKRPAREGAARKTIRSREVSPLPWQVAAFCSVYRRTFDAKAAAKAAGYKGYNSDAGRLRRHPAVVEMLSKLTLESVAAAQVSTTQTLSNMAGMANLDPAEFYKPGPDGKPVFRTIFEMPPHVRKCLKSVEVVRRNLGSGDGVTEEVLRVEWESPLLANKVLMQHLGLLIEKVEHQVTVQALSKLSDEEFLRRDRESLARFEAALEERRKASLEAHVEDEDAPKGWKPSLTSASTSLEPCPGGGHSQGVSVGDGEGQTTPAGGERRKHGLRARVSLVPAS
jgi:hypothetical protein